MHVSSRHPNVVVRFEGWDDINLVDDCIVPALRHGSTRTLRVVTDEALLHACHTLDIEGPHYTMFHSWGYGITSLHVQRADANNLALNTIELFYALAAMPSLVELNIWVNHLAHLAPVTETAPIPFHLARLTLHPVFCGWPRLIQQSAGTLREVVLYGVRSNAHEHGEFLTEDESKACSAALRSVTHLRLSNVFDPAIVHACPNLRTLDLNCVEHPIRPGSDLNGVTTCIDVAPRTLQNLLIGLHPSHADCTLVKVFHLLALRPGLRSVTIQPFHELLPRFQDVLNDEGRRARHALQKFCREHRISLILH